jgi:hypothetical protein
MTALRRRSYQEGYWLELAGPGEPEVLAWPSRRHRSLAEGSRANSGSGAALMGSSPIKVMFLPISRRSTLDSINPAGRSAMADVARRQALWRVLEGQGRGRAGSRRLEPAYQLIVDLITDREGRLGVPRGLSRSLVPAAQFEHVHGASISRRKLMRGGKKSCPVLTKRSSSMT